MKDNAPNKIRYLETDHGSRLAWTGAEIPGKPTLVFLPGHGSDMDGTKALAVAEWAARSDFGMIRFDYSGHGQSDGDFLDGTLGVWKQDCLAVIDTLTTGAVILIGSSLGGWLMMLIAHERKERIAGLIGIAAAPDFTDELIWDALTPKQRREMKEKGRIALPNPYAPEDVIYTFKLVEDGRDHKVLGRPISLNCPVRLLHGSKDEEVPVKTAERLAAVISSPDLDVIIDAEAGHRFSEPDQIELLMSCLDTITRKIG
jgi:pimeloyl-ACP methyl ester carboxylesterase